MQQKTPHMTVQESSGRSGFLDDRTKRVLIANILMITGTVLQRIGEQVAQSVEATTITEDEPQVLQHEQSTKQNPGREHDTVPQNHRMGFSD